MPPNALAADADAPPAGPSRRLARLRVLFLLALGAAGMHLGQPHAGFHLPWLTLLFPFCLFLLAVRAPTLKTAFRQGWALGFAGSAAGLYWLVHPMQDVAAMPFAAAALCAALLCAYLGLFPALAALGMRRLGGVWPRSPILTALAGGVLYAGGESLCGVLFTGFPWLSLSSAFALRPAWTQAASLVGGYGLSALFACAACLAGAAVCAPSGGKKLTAGLSAAGLLAALALFGHWRLSQPLPGEEGEALSLIMIQGDIDQNQKWAPEFQKATLEHYLALSRSALEAYRLAHGPKASPDLMIWPETAMPFYFQLNREYAAVLRDFARDDNLHLAFGCPGLEATDSGRDSLHNRIYLLSPTGAPAVWYDKRHLVPFGEYMPFAAHIPFLEKLMQGMDFTPGSRTAPLPLIKNGQGLSLGMLICYEAIFPDLAEERVDMGASVIINVSNDGWFKHSIAPWQHLSLSIMRAVEQARPMARSTNTGVSAVIDARGRVLEQGKGLFVADSLAAMLRPSREITLYHRLHPLPQYLLILLALAALSPRFTFRKR